MRSLEDDDDLNLLEAEANPQVRRVGAFVRRIQYARSRYHLISRGDRRELIFLDEKDRQQFLFTLGQTCGKTGWQVNL